MKVIVFTSEHCPYCRYFSSVVERLEKVLDVEFEIVDVSENRELMERYEIMILPTLVITDGEDVVGGFMGYTDFETALAVIEEQISTSLEPYNEN